jgi:hypothetical protein
MRPSAMVAMSMPRATAQGKMAGGDTQIAEYRNWVPALTPNHVEVKLTPALDPRVLRVSTD